MKIRQKKRKKMMMMGEGCEEMREVGSSILHFSSHPFPRAPRLRRYTTLYGTERYTGSTLRGEDRQIIADVYRFGRACRVILPYSGKVGGEAANGMKRRGDDLLHI
jgi:hypothetical protein